MFIDLQDKSGSDPVQQPGARRSGTGSLALGSGVYIYCMVLFHIIHKISYYMLTLKFSSILYDTLV